MESVSARKAVLWGNAEWYEDESYAYEENVYKSEADNSDE